MKNSLRMVLSLTCFVVSCWVIALALAGEAKSPQSDQSFSATCFCKISKDNLRGATSATGVVMNLTGVENRTFMFQGEDQQVACQTDCTQLVQKYYLKSQAVATAACAANAGDQASIDAYSAVGTKAYRWCENIGTLKDFPQVTQTTCTCPPGWYTDLTNVLGGVTTNGRCKKLACQPVTITPLPPNGTAVGSWGFTWLNQIWAYSSTSNGGAPTCITTVIAPLTCGWY